MAPSILLYEDNAEIRTLVTELLQEQGYEVTNTGSLEDGEQVAVDCDADLFLADTHGANRERAMETFRRICGLIGHEIPIVIFTAHPVAREEARDLGCADVVNKPFDIDDLLREVGARWEQLEGDAGKTGTHTMAD